MDRLAEAVILSWGWRRRAYAFAAGAVSAAAQPPFFLFPLLWLTFPLLVFLLDGAVQTTPNGKLRRFAPAFATGWWFGFGYFLAGLWWIGAAFLVESDVYGWMLPFAVLALPAGLALFWAAAAAVAQLFWSDGWRRIFALAFAFGAAEWLRGEVLTGFPWNSIGYALTAGEWLMQSAALFGLEGLNFLAVLIFAAPAALIAGHSDARRNFVLPALSLAAVAGLGLYGIARLGSADPTSWPDLAVRIVQPAIDITTKWEPNNKDEVFRTYLDLSNGPSAPLTPGTLLVWPESAFPFALTDEPQALSAIADLLPPETALVTGAYRAERLPSGGQRTFNSIYVLDDQATIIGAYDKVHLVPFGEYLPFQALLESWGLRQVTGLQGGFSSGVRRGALNAPFGPPFSPLICYEIIFPGEVLPEGPRPGFLLNVTNDTWFGNTPGPYQHFHQARIRSVEEGLSLVRAANSGISAIVDPYGRITAQSALGERTRVDGELVRSLSVSPNLWMRTWAPALFLVFSLVICRLNFFYRGVLG